MAYPFPADLALAIGRQYAQYCVTVARRLGVPRLAHAPPLPLAPGQRLRVGYVSSDFGNHPLSHLMGAVFGMHDRRRVPGSCRAAAPGATPRHACHAPLLALASLPCRCSPSLPRPWPSPAAARSRSSATRSRRQTAPSGGPASRPRRSTLWMCRRGAPPTWRAASAQTASRCGGGAGGGLGQGQLCMWGRRSGRLPQRRLLSACCPSRLPLPVAPNPPPPPPVLPPCPPALPADSRQPERVHQGRAQRGVCAGARPRAVLLPGLPRHHGRQVPALAHHRQGGWGAWRVGAWWCVHGRVGAVERSAAAARRLFERKRCTTGSRCPRYAAPAPCHARLARSTCLLPPTPPPPIHRGPVADGVPPLQPLLLQRVHRLHAALLLCQRLQAGAQGGAGPRQPAQPRGGGAAGGQGCLLLRQPGAPAAAGVGWGGQLVPASHARVPP